MRAVEPSTLTGKSDLKLPEFDSPPSDPIALLNEWLDFAERTEVLEPRAMVLATAGTDAAPSTRVVLVKAVDEAGLVFGTNGHSRKGRESSQSATAAGTFYWRETMQQINIAGRIEKLTPDESDRLFSQRPERAKAATRVSRQSEPLDSADDLHRRFADDLASGDDSRPAGWSGYRLRIERIEFWHGNTDRLHRRLEYTLDSSGWRSRRLQP